MKKLWNIRRLFIVLLLLAVAGAAMRWLVTPTIREPVYEGKTLSQWLEGHGSTSASRYDYSSLEWERAEKAVRKIGTNGIPTLLRMISAKDPSAPVLKVREWARKSKLIKRPYRHALHRNEEAEKGFSVLGTNAATAVPKLIDIHQARISLPSQRSVVRVLYGIGPPARAAVPVLLRDFTHTNDQVRCYAAVGVSRLGGEPAVLVPALRTLLNDPSVLVQWHAVNALSRFGGHARPAFADLVKVIPGVVGGFPAPSFRQEWADDVLWQIAPEKIGQPLAVGKSTSIVTNGGTAAAIVAVFEGERHTWIRPGTTVPCNFQFFSSEPRRLRLYCNDAEANDHFLGEFEIPEIPPPPATANVSLLCVITDEQIFLCARDNRRKEFVAVKRVDK